MSHCAQYCARKSAKLLMPQESSFAHQTRRPIFLLRQSSPSGVFLPVAIIFISTIFNPGRSKGGQFATGRPAWLVRETTETLRLGPSC
jgi:hypothetical protein